MALTLTVTILSFMNHTDLNTTKFKTLAQTSYFLLFANSFINALIILYRNKKSRKWLKECLHFCCKQRRKEEEGRSPEVIVNIGIEDPNVTSMVESDLHDSTDNKEAVDKSATKQ